jgi:hypothetical protein
MLLAARRAAQQAAGAVSRDVAPSCLYIIIEQDMPCSVPPAASPSVLLLLNFLALGPWVSLPALLSDRLLLASAARGARRALTAHSAARDHSALQRLARLTNPAAPRDGPAWQQCHASCVTAILRRLVSSVAVAALVCARKTAKSSTSSTYAVGAYNDS